MSPNSIEFKLVKGNSLLLQPGQCLARVQARTADLDMLIDRIMQHGSSVCRSDIASVLEDYYMTLENMLLEGWNVLTPGANFHMTIHGIFEGQGDDFDPARHRITAQVSIGKRLRRAIRERARAEKQIEAKPVPVVVEYYDVASRTRNQVLTPGDQGKLIGRLIKFDEADPAQGIFFVTVDSNVATRVVSVAWNGVSKHIFQVPVLTPGQYRLEVRALFSDNGTVRSGALEELLTVSSGPTQ